MNIKVGNLVEVAVPKRSALGLVTKITNEDYGLLYWIDIIDEELIWKVEQKRLAVSILRVIR